MNNSIFQVVISHPLRGGFASLRSQPSENVVDTNQRFLHSETAGGAQDAKPPLKTVNGRSQQAGFVDEAWIFVKGGDGGDGCRSFQKMRGKRYGRPTGGDGGAGGSVILTAHSSKNTLLHFKYNRHFKAASGKSGGSNNKAGRDGGDYILFVPPGTVVRDRASGLVLRDLKEPGDRVVIAKGGRGGRGNSIGRDAAPGERGAAKELYLELKLVADAGIVGYPNAGKSTLLSKITRARPRIANFPFTTKSPVLGVAEIGGFSFVAADIPGLIEGAHMGRGLGDRFLRHIERTKILIHLVDMAAVDCRNPNDDFVKLNNELKQYSEFLAKKKQLVAANKMDMPEARANIKNFKAAKGKKVYRISAATGDGIPALLKAAANELKIIGASPADGR